MKSEHTGKKDLEFFGFSKKKYSYVNYCLKGKPFSIKNCVNRYFFQPALIMNVGLLKPFLYFYLFLKKRTEAVLQYTQIFKIIHKHIRSHLDLTIFLNP